MIAYEVLCQYIADWKAGQHPASGPHHHGDAGSAAEAEAAPESLEADYEMLDADSLDE